MNNLELIDFDVVEIEGQQDNRQINGGWLVPIILGYFIWEALDAGVRIVRHEN